MEIGYCPAKVCFMRATNGVLNVTGKSCEIMEGELLDICECSFEYRINNLNCRAFFKKRNNDIRLTSVLPVWSSLTSSVLLPLNFYN